nr:hypothetical protein [Tanacetum cinerariifolium]
MLPVTQIDTFYNGLTLRHRDTINAAVGGTFMKRRPEECYDLIENMTAHHNDWDTSAQRSESSSSITSSSDTKIAALKAKMAEINKNLMRVFQVNQQVKAVTPNCETCGGPHSFNDCPATVGQTENVYDARTCQEPNQESKKPSSLREQPREKPILPANDAILKNMQTNMTSLTNSNLELKNMFGQFTKMNTASSSGSKTLPGNTITNPKEELKGITTRIGTAYQGPTIPTTSSSLPLVVERETEMTKDTPIVAPIIELVVAPIIEPVVALVSAPKPKQRPSIPFVDALILMPKFGPSIKSLFTNKDKLCELARTPLNEHYSAILLKKFPEKLGDPDKFLIPCDFLRMAECLALADLGSSINLMPLSVWNKLSLPELTPTLMTLELADRSISRPIGVAEDVYVKTERALIDVFEGELTLRVGKEAITFNLDQTSRYSEVDAFLALEDDPTSPKVDQSYVDIEGDILLIEAFLNDDPSLPLSNQGNYLPQVRKELKICEAKTDKSSIDEPPEVTTYLPISNTYFWKRAIAWKLSDIKGIDPEFCTHKILVKEDFEPVVQHERRVNPKIYDVIKKEVFKLLDAGLIYPISDSPWVIPVHCVLKKDGFTVVENEENELILTRLVTGWRVCIDYRKLNEATRKDQFPLPFSDQMLEILAGNEYYCFLYGFLGYFRIPIDPKDQEKTTFTCP